MSIFLIIVLLFFIVLTVLTLVILFTFPIFLQEYLIPKLIRKELDRREQNQEELQNLLEECQEILPILYDEEAELKALIEGWNAQLQEQQQLVQNARR